MRIIHQVIKNKYAASADMFTVKFRETRVLTRFYDFTYPRISVFKS